MANIPKMTPALRARRERVQRYYQDGLSQEKIAALLHVSKVTVRFDLITLGLLSSPALVELEKHFSVIEKMYLVDRCECHVIAEYLGVTELRMEYLLRLMHASGKLPYRPAINIVLGPEKKTMEFLDIVKAVPGWDSMPLRDLAGQLQMPFVKFKQKYKLLVRWELVEKRRRGRSVQCRPANPSPEQKIRNAASDAEMARRAEIERKQTAHNQLWRDVMRGKVSPQRVVPE